MASADISTQKKKQAPPNYSDVNTRMPDDPAPQVDPVSRALAQAAPFIAPPELRTSRDPAAIEKPAYNSDQMDFGNRASEFSAPNMRTGREVEAGNYATATATDEPPPANGDLPQNPTDIKTLAAAAPPMQPMPLNSGAPQPGQPGQPAPVRTRKQQLDDSIGQLQQDVVRFSQPVQDSNGRIKSGFMNMMAMLNQSYLAEAAAGGRWDAGRFGRLVAYGTGGFAAGAINPKLDEQRRQDYNRARSQSMLDQQMQNRDAMSQIEARDSQTRERDVQTGLLPKKLAREIMNDAQAAWFKEAEKYEKLDPNNPQHAALMKEGEALGLHVDPATWNVGNTQTITNNITGVSYRRVRGTDQFEVITDKEGQPVDAGARDVPEPPKEFATLDGADEKTIHAEAVKRAGALDFSQKAELDPEKVKLLTGTEGPEAEQQVRDMLRLSAISSGGIRLQDVVKDKDRALAQKYDSAVAAYESPRLQQLNNYREALASVSRTRSAQKINVAQFKQMYSLYQSALDKAQQLPADQRQDAINRVRNAFFGQIGKYRLTGPE